MHTNAVFSEIWYFPSFIRHIRLNVIVFHDRHHVISEFHFDWLAYCEIFGADVWTCAAFMEEYGSSAV